MGSESKVSSSAKPPEESWSARNPRRAGFGSAGLREGTGDAKNRFGYEEGNNPLAMNPEESGFSVLEAWTWGSTFSVPGFEYNSHQCAFWK